MENKQTAVEWIEDSFRMNFNKIFVDTDFGLISHIFNQAKEMEKKQIKDACEEGFMWSAEGWNGELISYYKDGNETLESFKEEYYNETYGKIN